MHGDTPGHAFVLVDRGKVLWYRDYWLAPTRSMYVEPRQLLADIPPERSPEKRLPFLATTDDRPLHPVFTSPCGTFRAQSSAPATAARRHMHTTTG